MHKAFQNVICLSDINKLFPGFIVFSEKKIHSGRIQIRKFSAVL